jgi:hypothetical protein
MSEIIIFVFEELICGECDFRCEECCECARTKPCECGCGLIGGSCEEVFKSYEEEEEEEEE